MRGATAISDCLFEITRISIHAPHAGSDSAGKDDRIAILAFQSTLPMRGATAMRLGALFPTGFQSTLPMRGATDSAAPIYVYAGFQSTLPMRGATRHWRRQRHRSLFQSTLPMQGATHALNSALFSVNISIHAPHAGSDVLQFADCQFEYISIHAPHAGSDHDRQRRYTGHHISIHAPHAGSDGDADRRFRGLLISIHAPHAGSDRLPRSQNRLHCHFNPRSPCGERHIANLVQPKLTRFQSTLPMRGATHSCKSCFKQEQISIHAPHAGSDWRPPAWWSPDSDFNPRSPCGERPKRSARLPPEGRFQSTLPMRGATPVPSVPFLSMQFQSTLPMRGATRRAAMRFKNEKDFNPRSPCGERRQILLPHRRPCYFNPRSPCGERLTRFSPPLGSFHFNPRSPCGERRRAA